MKTAGTLSVLLGGLALRAALVRAGRDELRLLRALAASLTLLTRQISATLAPLPRLLRQGDWPREAESFFLMILDGLADGSSIEQSWRAAAQAMPLRENERALLAAPSEVLRGDEEPLLRALRAAAEAMEAAAREKAARRGEQERLITAVCVSGTLMLLLVIV